MNQIFAVSDLHFGHDRSFIYSPRGFSSIEEHDETIISNWNNTIDNDDDVYVLGDLMLGNNEAGIKKLEQLNGKLHIIFGNHDTDIRKELYKSLPNVAEICGWSTVIKYRKYHFYLSHFPTNTGNLERESLHQITLNLFGHTHQTTNFYEDRPYVYHVGLDSHNNCPVLLDDIITDMNNKVQECLNYL